jgi:hypothetical protein
MKTKLARHHFRLFGSVVLLFTSGVSLSLAQNEQSPARVQAQSSADPTKFAVIISGASGEPAYAKQFQQWTSSLTTALTERFGFPKNRGRHRRRS